MKRIFKLATGIMLGLLLSGQNANAQVQGATIFNSFPTCQASPVVFTFSSGYSGGISRYDWYFGDQSPIVTLNNFDDTVITHTYNLPGVYQISLIIYYGLPVQRDTLYHSVFINAVPTSNFNAVGTCIDSSAAFTNLSQSNDDSWITHYYWNFGDGTGDHNENPGHYYPHPGVYNASLVVETNAGCRDTSIFKPVNVYRLPDAKILFPTNHICSGSSIRLEVNPYYNSYLWSATTHDTTWYYDVPSNLEPGLYEFLVNIYEVHLQDFKICFSKDSVEITVHRPPDDIVIAVQNLSSDFEITLDPTINEGDTIQLLVSSTNFVFNQIQWFPAEGLSNPFIYNPIAAPLITTRYLVNVSDNYGCQGRAEVVVHVTQEGDFYIGNIVTPNADSFNDVWIVGTADSFLDDTFEVFIYNRWGEEVLNQRGYQNDWNGIYNNRELPEGAYYYLIKGEDGISYTGSITLLR